MTHPSHSPYFETLVRTATPQRLRLLLIEGAIRFVRQAVAFGERNQPDEALAALARCRAILAELLSGVRPDGTPLTRQVAGLYVYLMKSVSEAEFRGDPQRVAELLPVLELERETWQTLCEQMPEGPTLDGRTFGQSDEITADGVAAILPTPVPRMHSRLGPPSQARSQFSIDG